MGDLLGTCPAVVAEHVFTLRRRGRGDAEASNSRDLGEQPAAKWR
jgi:hypothetical protein